MSTITVSVEWVASQDGTQLSLNTSGHDPVTLGIVHKRNEASPSNKWRWESCGSTWWAATMGDAMQQVLKRLEMPSHRAWCDYAEAHGIHPKP